MNKNVILDLGEYGTILIEPLAGTGDGRQQEKYRIDDVGLADEVRKQVVVVAQNVFQKPLYGLARQFSALLQHVEADENFALDEFGMEFNVGIELQGEVGVGATLKISPSGSIKCTYTWKRKQKADAVSTKQAEHGGPTQ